MDFRQTGDNGFALARELVARVGGHASSELGLDLDSGSDAALWGWLLACAVLGARGPQAVAIAASRQLSASDLAASPERLAAADPLAVASLLARAQLPRAEQAAALLLRLARGLCERSDGSLAVLNARADGLEELGEQLTRLAAGFGRAGVTRFLRGLRAPWPLAADLPLAPAALAAARHLGLVDETTDAEAAPAQLRRLLAPSGEHSRLLRDLEAALERVGGVACLRSRPARCPLGDACPGRSSAADGSA